MANATLAELRSYLDILDTDTFTAAPATDLLTLASVPFMNTLATGTEVTLTTTAADLPAPLAIDTVYYVHTIVDQTCALATTSALATAGTAINITDAGTGTHTITRAPADTDLLQDALDGAINYIEEQTHRVFVAAVGTRYYDSSALSRWNSRTLDLDEDCVTITQLLNGDSASTEIVVANYWLLDRNLGPPYHWIRLKTNITDYWTWDTDYWVSVTGTWGFSATCPTDVKQAQLHLGAFFYRQKDSQVFDITAIPEQGVIQIPQGIPATVTRVIDKYGKSI